jgi:hypothetical protein
MTIYDFLEMVNDNWETTFRLFNCNSEELVFMATEDAENTCEFSREDLLYSEYANCEIGSMDMWVDDERIYIEFNIEVEEDDEFSIEIEDDEEYN